MVTETYRSFSERAIERLAKAGCDSPAFEIQCMLSEAAGRVRSDEQIPAKTLARLEQMVTERESRRPLQYILGNWDFLRLTLDVGEGVLCPRPDTEVLCETAAAWLKASGTASPRLLDLCAGSGCVGLGTASLVPAAVTAVEWSDEAMAYLCRNIEKTGLPATAVKADVLAPPPADFPRGFDLLLSNPPYIPSADLQGLMPEVQKEPRIALDGGEDGLIFYRAIAENWLPLVRKGGLVAVEIGIGQERDVAAIFEQNGLKVLPFVKDLGGIVRVVGGIVL